MASLDVDTLIACVHARSSIWDKRDKSHSNRVHVDRCWKDIARNLDTDESALRKKWKYLREQFCVELGKIPQPFDGEEESYVEMTKWPYFKSLLFLKDVVKPRLSNTSNSNNILMTVPVDPCNFAEDQNVEEILSDSMTAENHSVSVDHPELLVDFNNIVENSLSAHPDMPLFTSNPRKRYCPSEEDGILECEQKRLNIAQTKPNYEDEDLMFFKSILPHVKKVKPAQKLLLRGKILELVSSFAYPLSRTEGLNHSSKHTVPVMNHKRKKGNFKSATSESD